MHPTALLRPVSSCGYRFPAKELQIRSSFHLPYSSQLLCSRASFDHQPRSLHRRHVVTTTSLGLLTNWLPFFGMAAKADFHQDQRWWRPDTVAVVTGANKGIGYGIAKILAEQGLTTVIAARNGSKSLHFLRLDITDESSVKHFAASLEAEFGGVTVLVNNAGFAYKGDVFGADEAAFTMNVNYRGTRGVCEAVQPMLTQNARIVNVSSRSGLFNILKSDTLRQRVETLTSTQGLDELAEDFITSIKTDKLGSSGWPRSMYGVSKLCETSYTRILAEQLKPAGVMVNACCPGYVNTDMTSHKGVKTLEQGADTPVWLALMPPGGPTGKLFAERKQIPF